MDSYLQNHNTICTEVLYFLNSVKIVSYFVIWIMKMYGSINESFMINQNNETMSCSLVKALLVHNDFHLLCSEKTHFHMPKWNDNVDFPSCVLCLCVCFWVCICVSMHIHLYLCSCLSICMCFCVSMSMCMCFVCLYVCVCVYVCVYYVCLCVCEFICNVSVSICVFVYVCVCVCLCVSVPLCVFMCVCVRVLCDIYMSPHRLGRRMLG